MTVYLLKCCGGGLGPSSNGDDTSTGDKGTLEGVVSMHANRDVAEFLAKKKMDEDPQKNSNWADFWYVRTYEVT